MSKHIKINVFVAGDPTKRTQIEATVEAITSDAVKQILIDKASVPPPVLVDRFFETNDDETIFVYRMMETDHHHAGYVLGTVSVFL